jgi:hypothetical protein
MDEAAIGAAFSRPGMDTRMWVSYGTVDTDTPDARSVTFTDDNGGPLPTGPLVTVTLQPSGQTVSCRVASFVAGNGEGSWYPFLERDEVIVVLPGGQGTGSPVIVGRLNQGLDVWPAIVAGQSATNNTFGFWRMRTPFIIESAESFLIRSAKTGSQIGIDSTGQVILNNGDRHNLFISSDAISLGNGEETTFLQLNFTSSRATLAVEGARFELSSSGESLLFAPGSLNIGTGGVRGKGHAISVEQVVGMFVNFLLLIAGPLGSPTLTTDLASPGKLLDPTAPFVVLDTGLATMLLAMTTPIPPTTAGTPGGNYAQMPLTFGPTGAIGVALLNPLPLLDPTGFIPGLGVGSLMF